MGPGSSERIRPHRKSRFRISGYFPDLVYERGKLDQSLPFDALRRQSHINERARAAAGADDFSLRIREGLPGMP